ncbi:MAG TPA: hypothetical protein VLM11_00660 [Streptosporangiaceae bacterium]|nr:hypothetical protein [Streptosporangiaceae bacterium]
MPVVVNGVVTGTASAVIDFSNGPDEPGAMFALEIPAGGRLLVGHVAAGDRRDPRVPVPAFAYYQGDFEADARCRSRPAASELGDLGADQMLLIVHRDDCGELAAIRELVA